MRLFVEQKKIIYIYIYKGLGHRLRLTNSRNKTLKENVELYSKSMAASGYNYEKVKKELLKFEKIDPVKLAKKPKEKSKSKSKGCKAYFISTFEPRVPLPIKLISKNYEILTRSENASKLFPRQNLISGSRRLKNLGELFSLTVQGGREGQGAKAASKWMVNHKEVAGGPGGRAPVDIGEAGREALEVEGWEAPDLLPKVWTDRMPWRRGKMAATIAPILQSQENVTCVNI